MVLAAAIKFHIDKTDKDVVLCGCRHGDIFKQLKLLGFEPQKGYKEIKQGFITDKNKFLTREEAYEHASISGQIFDSRMIGEIREEHGNFENRALFSEDLW